MKEYFLAKGSPTGLLEDLAIYHAVATSHDSNVITDCLQMLEAEIMTKYGLDSKAFLKNYEIYTSSNS